MSHLGSRSAPLGGIRGAPLGSRRRDRLCRSRTVCVRAWARTRPWLAMRDCALVSTSGSLLEATWGSEIDAHHVVFRIGQGPVGGRYAAHVGSRTTVRISVPSLFQVLSHAQPRPGRGTMHTPVRCAVSHTMWLGIAASPGLKRS
eukprot:scaffold16099_cov117-Isochrysis_galbana.AAC.4